MTGGTFYTFEFCKSENKPLFVINLTDSWENILPDFLGWFGRYKVTVLNIAGPRRSEGISSLQIDTVLYDLFFKSGLI